MLQDELVLKYKYKKLPLEVSEMARKEYLETLPKVLKIIGDKFFQVKTKSGLLISNGYKRIVIGDYGAFIEFDGMQVVRGNICIAEGEEYRINDIHYRSKVKYFWFTAKDDSGIKIYYQQKKVCYADYKTGMYYVSPFEIGI